MKLAHRSVLKQMVRRYSQEPQLCSIYSLFINIVDFVCLLVLNFVDRIGKIMTAGTYFGVFISEGTPQLQN